MQATTSGATHKCDVSLKKDTTKIFLKSQKSQFISLCNNKNVVYNKDTLVSDVALNYLNVIPENKSDEALKNILLKEYHICENLYPRLGDILLFKLFNSREVKTGKEFVFEKRHQNKFLKSIKYDTVFDIAEWFFKRSNLNRSIKVEEYHGNDLVAECLEEFDFKINYDFSFYHNLNLKEVKNYRFVLINGIIETVGEIHHLLHKANENKEPYVIFCFGMSESVKQTIIKNNAAGRLRVYPVCLDTNDEHSLNILNDLAAIHSESIVSSDLGQTISQEIRKTLPVGKKITFFNGGLSLVPVANEADIEVHRIFLRNRLLEANAKIDVRTDILENRLKMFTGKRVNFYIPRHLMQKKDFTRELDYYFRFISNLSSHLKVVSLLNQKFYIPSDYIKFVEAKKKSLLSKFYDIHAIIC